MLIVEYGNVVTSLLVTLGLAFIISLSLRPLQQLPGVWYSVVLGAMFGLAAIMSMVFGGFLMGEGLLGDMRNVLVVSSGIFSGPVGALVATSVTAIFRLMLEGNPAGGIIAIIGAGVAGVLFGRAWKHRLTRITWLQFFLVGLTITGVNIMVPMIAIPAGWLDWDTFLTLTATSLPIMLFAYTLGVIAIGMTLRVVLDGIRAEKNVYAAKLDAEKASRGKSEFLASMSHELRTPMNAVLGFAQLLHLDPKKNLSDQQVEHVSYILEGGNHLLELINEILDLSRIEANQAIFHVEHVNVAKAVQNSLDMMALQVGGRKISIINHTKKQSDLFVVADGRRVRQILLNFVSNAVKYNHTGGTVTLEASETDDGFCRISVSDTGIGIAEADRPELFQIFHRLESQSMTAREGNGIGLAVSRMLAEQMSGRVDFDSKVGVGSTFWVDLPIAKLQDQPKLN